MSRIYEVLICCEEVFKFFEEVYLFGSSLYKDAPEDIDLVLVYRTGEELRRVSSEKQKILDLLSVKFCATLIDLTTLSEDELSKTRFLGRINHKQVKGPSCQPETPT